MSWNAASKGCRHIRKNWDSEVVTKQNVFQRSLSLAGLYLLLLYPLVHWMPPEIAWENGPIENAQLVPLALGAILSIKTYQQAGNKAYRRSWLYIAGAFLLMIGRELSWGRVFFPRGIEEDGPVFYPMSAIPGHTFIHAAIGLFMLLVAFGLVRHFPWKRALGKMPARAILLSIAFVALAFSAEHVPGLFSEDISMKLEEFAELGAYFLLWSMTVHMSDGYERLECAVE